mmetsp:Transcript_2612/g.4897  ORF Transcript_2612/g.4897 Transcript_2612/m.4897 type:complete len:221 (+) Transcript_2612:464-1126(+)
MSARRPNAGKSTRTSLTPWPASCASRLKSMSSRSRSAMRSDSSIRRRSPSERAMTNFARRSSSRSKSCRPYLMVSVKSKLPAGPSRDSRIRFSSRSHWNLSSRNSTCRSRSRRAGLSSVSSRRATYGYATSRKWKSGSRVMQMPSWVSRDRMTSAYRSGTRMGYWYTSSLKRAVTLRKLKSRMDCPMEFCQICSSAGTMGPTSVPRARKPNWMKSPAIAS